MFRAMLCRVQSDVTDSHSTVYSWSSVTQIAAGVHDNGIGDLLDSPHLMVNS